MIAETQVEQSRSRAFTKKTLEQYFDLEEKATYKNELHNGKIIPKTSKKYNHGMLSGTIYALLFMLYFNSEEDITILSNDQKIYISDHHRIVYPDVSVVVGEKEMYQDGNQSIMNPTVIVEVASQSTGQYDRQGKFRLYHPDSYRGLPSFQEYVLVDQNMPIVEVFYKIKENQWKMTAYVGLDEIVTFETLGVELKMSDIYKKVIDLQDPQMILDFPLM